MGGIEAVESDNFHFIRRAVKQSVLGGNSSLERGGCFAPQFQLIVAIVIIDAIVAEVFALEIIFAIECGGSDVWGVVVGVGGLQRDRPLREIERGGNTGLQGIYVVAFRHFERSAVIAVGNDCGYTVF